MKHFALFAVLLLAIGCAPKLAPAPASGLDFGGALAGLARPYTGTAMHQGSWDRAGGNGDARGVDPGQTITLFDHRGAGIVRRFWVTIAPRSEAHIHRQAILRMYWDDQTTPAVEVPIGDFFGVGFGEQKDYISLPLNETSGGYNCYWPMPFHKSARWTLENRSNRKIDAFYYNIDYTAYERLPEPNLRNFHAHWRRENPTRPGQNYTILDTTGSGHVVGAALFMQARKPRGLGFLEGDEMLYIDGVPTPGHSAAPPRTASSQPSPHGTDFVGTGTEDYFSSGWYFDRGPYSAPFHGCVIKDELTSRISAYRWHIPDAIPFTRSIRFTIEHGHNNDHEADYSSVCYFYAAGDVKPAPPLPADAKDLLALEPPPVQHFPGVIEAEALRDSVRATGGNVNVQTMEPFAGRWSGDAQIFWTDTRVGQSLTLRVPLEKPGAYDVRLHFTKAPDYAVVTARVNDGALGAPIDLYDARVVPSGPISLGRFNLRAGEATITLSVSGKNAKSSNTLVGIDAVEVEPAK